MKLPAAEELYFLVTTCEGCGRRIRASARLRFWAAAASPRYEDSEVMVTKSEGPKKLTNERDPLWPLLKATPTYGKGRHLRDKVGDFFDTLAAQLEGAARDARTAAYRARLT